MKKRLLKNGLLASLGVVSATIPLVSVVGCSKKESNTDRIGSEFDKEYGIDASVYKKLKTTFVNKVLNDPEHPLTEEQKQSAKNDLNSAFKMFDAQFKEQNLSYTAVTNAMIEYAYRAYDIKLEREKVTKTVSWDELDAAFEGMCESMKAFMSELPEEVQQAILNDAAKQYYGDSESKIKGLKNEITDKYADPLMGLSVAKSKLWACFARVNEDIGLVSAAIRLSDFMENHEIFYNTDTNDDATNKYDNFSKQPWFQEALKNKGDISAHILDIFTITDKTTGEELTTFDSTKVCPGYVVKPMLKGVTADPITNKYSLNIDWTCMNNAYAEDAEKALNTTAHFFKDANGNFDPNTCTSAHEYFANLRESAGMNYNVILSKQGEIDALKSIYFNDTKEHIILNWADDEKMINSYESFFFGERVDDGQPTDVLRKYNVDNDKLAMSGIKLGTKAVTTNGEGYALTRLEELIDRRGISDDAETKMNVDNELLQQFIDNCTLSSIATITNKTADDDSAVVSNTVFASYMNTTYKYKFVENEGAKIVDKLEKSCFRLTNVSYEHLTNKINEMLDITDVYENNIYKEQYEAVRSDLITQCTLYGMSGLFAIWTTAFCFAPVFAAHIPIYIILLTLTWLSMGAQSAIIGLFVKNQWNEIKKYSDNAEKLSKNEYVTKFTNKMKTALNANDICRWTTVEKNYHTIKEQKYNTGLRNYSEDTKDFVTDILPTIEELQFLNTSDDFNNFYQAVLDGDCDPEKFEEKMKPWDDKGWCKITTIALSSFSITLDFICCGLMFFTPEMYSWRDVKLAKAMANATGGNFKTFAKAYNSIRQARSLVASASKAVKNGHLVLDEGLKNLSQIDLKNFITKFGEGVTRESVGFPDLINHILLWKYIDPECLKRMMYLGESSFVFEDFLKVVEELDRYGYLFHLDDFAKLFIANNELGKFTDISSIFLQRLSDALLSEETQLGKLIYQSLKEEVWSGFFDLIKGVKSAAKLKRYDQALEYLKEADQIIFREASYDTKNFVRFGQLSMNNYWRQLIYFAAEFYQDVTKALKSTVHLI